MQTQFKAAFCICVCCLLHACLALLASDVTERVQRMQNKVALTDQDTEVITFDWPSRMCCIYIPFEEPVQVCKKAEQPFRMVMQPWRLPREG